MWKVLACFTVLVGTLLAIPTDSVGQQKNKAKKDAVSREEATPQDYLDLGQAKEVVGKLADVNVKAGTLTLTIEWSRWEPKADAKGKGKNANQKPQLLQQQLLRDYEQIMRIKNPVQRQEALMKFQLQLQQSQGTTGTNLQKMFQIAKATKDFDLDFVADVKVARAQLDRKYNDEGELIKYTAEELKKLKSPDVPNAYKAAPIDLRAGQSVRLYLGAPKKQESKKADSTADAKDKQSVESTQSGRPQVRMVLILEDDIGFPDPVEPPKNKKKG